MWFRQLLFSLAGLAAFAQTPALSHASIGNCPTIDLTVRPPLNERKNTYQGDTGSCCSYAVSDAIALKFGKNYSPIDIALTQANAQKRRSSCSSLDEIPKAINASHGLCSEQHFKQMKNPGSKFINLKPGDDLKEFRAFVDTSSHSNELDKLESLWEKTQTDPRFKRSLCNLTAPRESPIFANINNYQDIGAVIEKTTGDYYEFLYNLAEKNCPIRDKVHLEYEKIAVRHENDTDLYALMNSGRSPVIQIHTNTLFKTDSAEESLNRKLKNWISGDHAVNLVGVRPIDGKCYVKVRDSSFGGKDCVDSNRPGVLCSGSQKDDGTYEVDATIFFRAARSGLVIK